MTAAARTGAVKPAAPTAASAACSPFPVFGAVVVPVRFGSGIEAVAALSTTPADRKTCFVVSHAERLSNVSLPRSGQTAAVSHRSLVRTIGKGPETVRINTSEGPISHLTKPASVQR